MDTFSEKIKAMDEMEFPAGLHGKIMKKLLFLQFRTPFLIVLSLLLLNMAITGWNLWTRAADSQFQDVIKAFLSSFEFSREYFSSFYAAASDFMPLSIVVNFTVNLLLIGYLFYLSRAFQRLGKNRIAENRIN